MRGEKRTKEIHLSKKRSVALCRIIFHCIGMHSKTYRVKSVIMITMQQQHNTHTGGIYVPRDRHFGADSFLYYRMLLRPVSDLQVVANSNHVLGALSQYLPLL